MNPPNVSPSQAQLDGVLASGPMGCRSRSASLNRAIRYLQAVAFVGVWMASGWIMHLDANSLEEQRGKLRERMKRHFTEETEP